MSEGSEPLTADEIAFIDERIAENKDKLQGIVKVCFSFFNLTKFF